MPTIKANVLLNLRRNAHLTQREVAQRAGITRSYLSKLENTPNSQRPSDDVVVSLARVLEVPPAELYDLEIGNIDEEVLKRAIRKMNFAEIIAVHYNVEPEMAQYLASIEDESIRARIALDQAEQRAGRPPIYPRLKEEAE